MDLEVLNLKADTSSVEKATDAVEALDNKLSRAEKTVAKAEQALKILRGEAVKVGDGVVRLGDGFTKSQANMLAMLKQAGATTAELKAMAKTMDQLNKITSTNPFDKSVQALNYVKKQREELTKSIKYAERYNDLTKEQIGLMTRGIESVRQRATSEQKNFGEREAAVKKFIKEFVKEAQSYNQVTAAIEEKNRVAREEIRLQQEQSRAAQVSAKQRADAEDYVQETLRRTLFINEQLEKGMSVSGANSLYAYKQQLDVLGLSADQAAAKMREFQNALTQNQTLRADRSPFKKMSEDIQETNRQVNHLARAVSVQLGDVFVSLASGQNPFIVAIQQGDQIRGALEQAKAAGQSLDSVMKGAFASMANSFVMVGTIVKDFVVDGMMSAGNMITRFNTSLIDAAGNMVGLGNVMTNQIKKLEEGAASGNKFDKAMLGVMNTMRFLAGGLLLSAIAGITTFIVASIKLSNDLDRLAIALTTTGASLGMTTKQAQLAAETIGQTYGTNVYKALDAVTLFATKNIKFTDEMIASAVEFSRVTGKGLSDIIDSYSSLKGKPVEGLLDVAIATGEVNIETVKQIDKLVEQGETAKATQLAMDEKARAEQEAARNTIAEMTPLGQLWLQMKKDVSSLSDAVYDLVTKSVLVDVFAVAWKGLASVFHVITWAVQGAGKMIGGVAAQLVALANLDFSGVMNIGNSMMSDAASGYRELEGTLKSLWNTNDELTRKELEASAQRRQESNALASQYKKEYESRKKGADEAGKEAEKTQKYFDKLMEGASDLALNTRQEVSKLNSGYEQMTNSQKALFDAQNDPRWKELTEKQKEQYIGLLKTVAANEELIQQYHAQVALQEILSGWSKEYASAAASIQEEVAALELRNNLLYKTEDEAKAIQRQYDLNVKLAAVENKYIERRNQMMMDYVKLFQEGKWSPEALAEYERNMAAVNQQEAQERQLAQEDANTKIKEDFEKKFKETQATITDIIATAMFEGGKAGSKKLKDVLNQSFRNYVIDVFINPIVGSIMGSITGGAGSSGQSSGGVTGLISNASSAYNLATGSTIAGISGVVQGAGAFLGSSAISSFGAGMTMTGTQVAALSEAGLVASKAAASLGSTFATVMPWIAGGLLVADLLGVFDKKPSDKTSWAVIDPTTGRLGEVGDMGGKKAASEEQKTANTQLSQLIGGFAALTGITGKIVTAMGSRDGVRLAIEGGFDTPMGQAAGGSWLDGQTAYNYGSDPATAAVKMMEDLLDEGTLSQSVIDSWNALKTTAEGTTKDAVELMGNLDLLVAGFDEEAVRRADLIQQDNESIQNAFMRMKEYERILSGGIAQPGDLMADVVNKLQASFESLGLAFPTTVEGFNGLISGLDMTSEAGKQAYVTLMELFPAWLELETTQSELYNGLKTSQEKVAQSSSDMSMIYKDLGISIPRSSQELRGLIDAQDESTEAGAKLKAQLLGTVPVYLEWQEQMVNSFGITADSIRDIFSTVLQESGSAKEAAQKASEMFSQQVYDALLGSVLNSVTEMVFSGIITPMINSLVSQTAVAATNMAVGGTIAGTAVSTGGMLAGQELAAIVDKINVYLGAMSQILSDPAIKAAIENISKTVGNVAGSIYTISDRKQPTSNTQAGATSNGRDETDKLADSLKKYLDENKRMQAELLELQGRTQEAKDLLRALAIEGLTPLEVKAYDANQALRNQIEAMKEAQRLEKEIADQRNSLETQLLQLQGNTVELRRRELEALHESNRGLQEMIWSIEDSKTDIEATKEASIKGADAAMDAVDKAFDALQRAVDREKEIVQSRIDVLENSLSKLKGVFDFLKGSIDSLLGNTNSASGMRLSQANEVIKKALLSGLIPDEDAFQDAVGVAVQGVEKGIYASRADQERATILLANDLSKINVSVGEQISETEMLIALEKKELERLDNILETAQHQINVLKGIDDSVISVEQAVNNLAAAILNANTAKVNAAAASASSLGSMTSPSQARDAGFITSPINQYGSFTGIGDSGYRLQTTATGATLLFPGGGSHSASGTDAAQVLAQTYGLTSGGLQGTLIRTRAKGGYTPPGMTLVGEEGPELVNFRNPSMVYTASQTSSLLSGGGNLEEAIDALRDEMIMLRAETRAVALNTSKSAKLLDRAMPDGQSILVTTTA